MPITQTTHPYPRVRHSFDRKHILLVDDDPSFRSMAADILVQAGYEVKQAHDGHQALGLVLDSVVGNEHYDLIITDVMMPNMSGIELLKTLCANGISIPALAITGLLDVAVFEEIHEMEHLDFILKPFKPKEFVGYVAEMISADHKPDRI